MNKNKILIVEDEDSIRLGLIDLFTYHGLICEEAINGEEALEKALTNTYDVILLDVMMPKLSGYEVCNKIRESKLDTPIIMLTAKDTEEDIINGLTLGADDYVTKPFSVRELVLRVQCLLKRCSQKKSEELIFENHLSLEYSTLHGKFQNGSEIRFTAREAEVLQYLQTKGQEPTSREELLKEVWGYTNIDQIETRTVDIHMAKLRKKIETDPKNPKFIKTIRSKGYRLENCQ